MNLQKDLVTLRKAKGMSQATLAEQLSKMLGTSISKMKISRWENGTTAIPLHCERPLAELLGVELPRNDEEVIASQPGKLRLNEAGFQMLAEYGDYLRTKPQYVIPEQVYMLPFYLQPASAGTGQYLDDASSEQVQVSEYLHQHASFVVRVAGDSMEPYAYDGDIAFVLAAAKGGGVEPGGYGLFSVDGESYIKQYHVSNGAAFLHSLNPAYEDIPLEGTGNHLFGRVVAVLPDMEKARTYKGEPA